MVDEFSSFPEKVRETLRTGRDWQGLLILASMLCVAVIGFVELVIK